METAMLQEIAKWAKVFGQVKEILVSALAVDEDKVVPSANLARDLGAKDINFLDIVHRMRMAFDIRISRDDALFSLRSDFWKDGKATPSGVALVKELFPTADTSVFEADSTPENLTAIYTVELLVGYVVRAQAKSLPLKVA